MIEHLRLTDFKAFHELNVGFRPITVLLGPNNAGKSSIIAALRLLAQTVDTSDRGVPLLLDGSLGDFGTYRDLVHGHLRSRPMRIGLTSRTGRPWRLDLEFKYRIGRRQLVLREAELSDKRGHLVTVGYRFDLDRHVVTKLGGRSVPPRLRTRASLGVGLDHFIPWLFRATRPEREAISDWISARQYRNIDSRIDDIGMEIAYDFRRVEYLGAMRLPPERTYHQTGEARARVGASGENWAGILVLDSSRARSRSRNVASRTAAWLKRAGLAKDVRLHWLSDRHYEVQVQHPVSNEYANLADVGQGNSQVLPVLVGGYHLAPGSAYLVEEPEIHLHPRAQAELGNFFMDLYSTGVSSVVETHSEYLLLRLQQHVARGHLPAGDIAFYYVDATRTGRKRVRRLTLDEKGRFRSPLPGGFFPQRLDEARTLARLRAHK